MAPFVMWSSASGEPLRPHVYQSRGVNGKMLQRCSIACDAVLGIVSRLSQGTAPWV